MVFSADDSYKLTSYGSVDKSAYAQRPDGKILAFKTYPTVEPRDGDTVEQLTRVDAITWRLRTASDDIETYKIGADNLGKVTYASLKSIQSRNGIVQTLAYASNGTLASVTDSFGRTLSFAYDTSGRVSTMTNPAGGVTTYQYNTGGYLNQVTFPDSSTKQYVYGDSANVGALTSVIDESNTTYASWSYDSSRRAVSSQHAGGAERVDFTFNSNGTTTVTDALGSTRVYSFGVFQSVPKTTAMLEGGISRGASFDTNGFLQSRTDRNGVQTVFARDSRGRETSRTEAYGTARARTITTQWHSGYDLPTQIDEPGRRTVFTHDANGNVLTQTVTDTASSTSRTWTYSYSSLGQTLTVNGPRTDVSDVTTYTYYNCATGYQCGQLHTVTNAAGHTTTYNTYNAHGQPLTVTDPNGVVTTLTYDTRQRLTSRTVGAEVTSVEYWPTGLIKKVTMPDASYLSYAYDAAHRLTGITDAEGNRIAYTLDAMGNRITEETFDPSNALASTQSRVFNSLNRLYQQIGAAGTSAVTTSFGYDTKGNLTAINAPLSRTTSNSYDELDRLTQVTDPASGVTARAYNVLDQLISVTDPRGGVTSYTTNALGDLTEQVSPDTGTTSSTYDSGGNLSTRIDARGKTGTYNYDVLNRLTALTYPDQSIAYTYDQGTNGVGRLTEVSDNSGSTAWTYDGLGRIVTRQQVMSGVSKTVSYGYNSAGQLTSWTLPSGAVISAAYTAGKVTSLTLNGSTTILSNVLYRPSAQRLVGHGAMRPSQCENMTPTGKLPISTAPASRPTATTMRSASRASRTPAIPRSAKPTAMTTSTALPARLAAGSHRH